MSSDSINLAIACIPDSNGSIPGTSYNPKEQESTGTGIYILWKSFEVNIPKRFEQTCFPLDESPHRWLSICVLLEQQSSQPEGNKINKGISSNVTSKTNQIKHQTIQPNQRENINQNLQELFRSQKRHGIEQYILKNQTSHLSWFSFRHSCFLPYQKHSMLVKQGLLLRLVFNMNSVLAAPEAAWSRHMKKLRGIDTWRNGTLRWKSGGHHSLTNGRIRFWLLKKITLILVF